MGLIVQMKPFFFLPSNVQGRSGLPVPIAPPATLEKSSIFAFLLWFPTTTLHLMKLSSPSLSLSSHMDRGPQVTSNDEGTRGHDGRAWLSAASGSGGRTKRPLYVSHNRREEHRRSDLKPVCVGLSSQQGDKGKGVNIEAITITNICSWIWHLFTLEASSWFNITSMYVDDDTSISISMWVKAVFFLEVHGQLLLSISRAFQLSSWIPNISRTTT